MDRWTLKERLLIPEMMEIYAGTEVAQLLLFTETLWDLFDDSTSPQEAYAKRDTLAREAWWHSSWHLTKCVEFLCSEKFDRMVNYLARPDDPRCGQTETLISVWRQIEVVRGGVKSPQGRLDHLELFQLAHYLGEAELI